MSTVIYVLLTIAVSAALTAGMTRVARRFDVVDRPTKKRKIHTQAIPLLGGVAVILSFTFGVAVFWPQLVSEHILAKHIVGVLLGAAFILIGGALDDKYDLPPAVQFIFPLLAIVSVIVSGIGINYITNPFGEIWYLDEYKFVAMYWDEVPYRITLLADIFTIAWLLGTMYTTKFLDGLDGLVSGITIIGSIILFGISISAEVSQPDTALLAIIAAAAFFGFLLFNWHPAKIFLGESGSLFAGFILGVLAIISGGKIATALLILGIPILDVVWVILRRLFIEKRSPFSADRKHLHLRLLDAGLSQRKAVMVLYTLTAVFGASALFLQSHQKAYALAALVLTMCILGFFIIRIRRHGTEYK